MVAAVVGAVAACGKGASAPSVRSADGRGERPPPAACPAEADVEARLRARWSLDAGWKVEATCAPGRFPVDGWAISAVVDLSEDEAWERSVVLAGADGRALAEGERHDVAPWYRAEGGGGERYEPRDLDGDGVDELVARSGASHGGSTTEVLVIKRLAGAAIADALAVTTHLDNGGAAEDDSDRYECDAAVSFVPDGEAVALRLVGTIDTARTDIGGDGDDDCFRGPRTYRLVGGAFVRD